MSTTATDSSSGSGTNTNTALFPTSSSSNPSNPPGDGPNVYYLVFLGVLVVLLCMAACLGFRAFRLRRRYQSATQRAIARGDPLPDVRDDYWGLGGLSAWTQEGLDRLTNSPGTEEWAVRRDGRKTKWDRIPRLSEAIPLPEKERESSHHDSWNFEPLTLHSLKPLETPLISESIDEDQIGTTPFQLRRMGPRPRPPPLGLSNFVHRRRPDPNSEGSPPPARPEPMKELDRGIGSGEMLRIAVMVQMPQRGSFNVKGDDRERQDEEDETGWEPGMEIGVWQGQIRK
ncbi:hypothetical protein TREMEDRAFT_65516 [Tremella mesenterica DSM 1558]|uniref:uncharacterized protein n=1 Tax=Tremella mesenterica (strain ATCC 24925 / CBS 8224 / DSM 1558 / NBRC 9311 / NRRL Y-6157 / RJB 2259-6 / UBC 559-6) TaxID=578456 RepID=UPI00032CA2AD|nr:uncharacterized protein TREMEDRAFT_65516 [Tremella mesenterica DSM 1558]EIW66245.1 hypothetical protein TREMEDRAFT_65516 [Tremella mesenterica DSM 1558]